MDSNGTVIINMNKDFDEKIAQQSESASNFRGISAVVGMCADSIFEPN